MPSDLVAREARAADLIIVGPGTWVAPSYDLVEPGVILLRAGRPVLVQGNRIWKKPVCGALLRAEGAEGMQQQFAFRFPFVPDPIPRRGMHIRTPRRPKR